MKSLLFFSISFLIIFSWFWIANAQPVDGSQAKQKENSILSPESLERFQDEDLPVEKREKRTLKRMYSKVNFIDLRGMDATIVMNSGFSGEQGSFESLSGYNVGLTWEFPIMAKKLGGSTPILKVRAGKSEIKSNEVKSGVKLAEASANFVDSLGVSEIYTVGVGAGYCYQVGFTCMYAMYNTYLTGQMSVVEDDGSVSSVPTQLRGGSVGMSSSFEIPLGVELTLGLEYSMLTHSTPIDDDQEINTISLVLGMGFRDQSRYLNMREIEFID